MKQRIISFLLAVLMTATILPVQAWGATVVDSGTCGGEGDGSNLTWTLDSDGLLTIEGSGEMADWGFTSRPWDTNYDKIKRAIIGNGVTSIGINAFWSCQNLTSVTIPNSVTTINAWAFGGCEGLTSVTIPDSVISIGDYAFFGCINVATVNIGSGLASIGEWAFIACGSSSIQVDSRNGNYCSVDGVLFDKNRTTLLQYPMENPASSYTVPSSVTLIGNYAFAGCQNLANVIIPNSVLSIGGAAFYECYALNSVAIGNNVTSIGSQAFDSCRRLTNVTIPSSVISIGEYAFHSCSSLRDVYYGGSKEQWKAISIDGYNSDLTSATIHYGRRSSIYSTYTGELAMAVYENRLDSSERKTDYQLSRNAKVSTGSASGTTNEQGQASLAYTGGAVTVSKSGYVTRTISEAALGGVDPTVWLQKESDSYPVISAVWMDDVYDIMNAEFYLPLVQTTAHSVRAEVSWGSSGMRSLQLTQGSVTMDISDSGNTSLTWSDKFDLSREILVVATNTEGKRTSKVLKIKSGSEITKILNGYEFHFGDSLNFTLPDSVSVIGGTSMALGLYSPVMVDYALENGKIYVAIGLNADETTEKDDKTGKIVTKVKTFADSVKKLKENPKKLRDLLRGKTELKGSWGIDVGFHVAGYMEGYFDENNIIHWLDSGLIVGAEGGVDSTYPFIIPAVIPIPVYVEAGFQAQLESKLALAVSEAAKKFTPDGTVSGSVAINFGPGLGVNKLASFGVGAEGEIGAEMQYRDRCMISAKATLSLRLS